MTELIRLAEAAKLIGVSLQTLRRWDNEGKIKTVRTPGNQRRMHKEEIERLLGKVGYFDDE